MKICRGKREGLAIFKLRASVDETLPVIQDGGQGGGLMACQWYRKTRRRVKLPASEAEALLDAGVDIEGDGIRATPCSLWLDSHK
jgi:hypothetical protein